jgi:hypothetical protein
MVDRRKRDAGVRRAAVPLERTLLHRTLIRLGVPRFMVDHATALLAANRRPVPKGDDPTGDDPRGDDPTGDGRAAR